MSATGRSGRYVVLGLVIGVALFYLAVREVEWVSVGQVVASASPGWLVLAFLALVLKSVLLAARWRTLAGVDSSMAFKDAFDFIMIANVASVVVPSRVADVIRAVTAGRYHRGSSSRLFGTILVERLMDVVVLLGIGATLSVLMAIPAAVQGALITLFAGALAATAVVWLGKAGPLGWVAAFLLRLRGPHSRSLPIAARLMEGLGVVRERRRMPLALGLALLAWVSSAAVATCVLVAVGLPTPWYAGAFVVLLINLGGMIPAPPAGMGVYHYVAMLAVSPWVADSSTAFAFALVAHATALAGTLVLGGFSLVRKGVSIGALLHASDSGAQES